MKMPEPDFKITIIFLISVREAELFCKVMFDAMTKQVYFF